MEGFFFIQVSLFILYQKFTIFCYLTVKVYWPEDFPSGLMISTVQVAASVPKTGLMVIAVLLKELIVRLA